MSGKWHRILIRSWVVAALLVAVQAPAQVARVFLSGTGDDTNDCSNAATPCRSLQGAVSQSLPGGEIIVMTSGGFGAAAITKSLTINAPDGIVAFDARTITVSLGATDKVIIRGLSMNGAVFGDTAGISFTSGGTLVVEDSKIAGFLKGIYQEGSGSNLVVKNCEIRKNGTGIVAWPTGPTVATLLVEHSRFTNNTNWGLTTIDNVRAVVRDSVAIGNGVGFNLDESVTGGSMLLDACVASHNGTAISATGYNQVAAIIRVTNSTIFGNTYGLGVQGTGQIVSYGTNHLWRSPYAPSDSVTFSSTVPRQ